ncbi:hypothetical protein SDC9_160141 [bioreactor metagenome]|uniref:Uncharacterized protein n=1 Tax=bioreactor metagenome TaxID=1076179 RepID=A0A645FEL4_9ZZZZ
MNPRGFQPGNRWPHRPRTRGQHQGVIADRAHSVVRAYRHRPGVRIKADDLVARADIQIERGPQRFGPLDEKPGRIGDLASDVVREPAVGEGHVIATIEHDDLCLFIEPAGTSRTGHSAGNTSDDNDPHQSTSFAG